VTLLLSDGRTLTGFIAEERSDAVVVRDPSASGATVVIPNSDIDDSKQGRLSLFGLPVFAQPDCFATGRHASGFRS